MTKSTKTSHKFEEIFFRKAEKEKTQRVSMAQKNLYKSLFIHLFIIITTSINGESCVMGKRNT